MKLYIKYMVGMPCNLRVKEELDRLKIPYGLIAIGIVELPDNLSTKNRRNFNESIITICLKAGATDFIYKPFEMKVFQNKVQELLERI